jgi:hypothetical protein
MDTTTTDTQELAMNTTTSTRSVCCNQDLTRAVAGEGPWVCMDCGAAQGSVYVATQSNRLNCQVFRVTALADGMELVEHVGTAGYNLPADIEGLLVQARGIATATGSVSATHRVEGAGGVVLAELTYYANGYAAPRLTIGVHKAIATLDPAQAALKAEAAAQGEPVNGARFVVSELSGYELVQNRSFDHRACGCGNGTTTYAAGIVTGTTYYADNSIEVAVELESGRTVTVQTKAPSGDVCY